MAMRSRLSELYRYVLLSSCVATIMYTSVPVCSAMLYCGNTEVLIDGCATAVFTQAPNEETQSALRSLFPSSARSRPPLFELASNVGGPPSKKRKLSLERRKRVTVCLLPAAMTTVPRGATRVQLSDEGRVKEILFLRSWTEYRVRQSIAESFLPLLKEDNPEDDILFMSSNAGAGISSDPDPNTLEGASTGVGWNGSKVLSLAGRGCLYIKSKKRVQEVWLSVFFCIIEHKYEVVLVPRPHVIGYRDYV